MRLVATFAVAAGLAASAAASDIEIHDFRMAVGATPGPTSTDEKFTAGSGPRASGSHTWTSNAAPQADLNLSWVSGVVHDWGYVYGFGMDGSLGIHNPSGLGTRSLQIITIEPQIRAGIAYAPNTSFHFELTPFVGYGIAAVQWGYTGEKDTGWGTALVYGLLLSGIDKLGEGWYLGGDVGYQGGLTTASVDFGSAGGHSDLTLHSSGALVRFVLAYQF
jgi:hypothetical protein